MTNVNEICTPKNNNEVFFHVRKYAGRWVPVVMVNGKKSTFAHCQTSGGAIRVAMRQACRAVGAEKSFSS